MASIDINLLLVQIAAGSADVVLHALQRMLARGIGFADVATSVTTWCERIEDYPNAFPWPACLLLSRLPDGRPLHSVWAWNDVDRPRLVTAYRPDESPQRWTPDFRRRLTP